MSREKRSPNPNSLNVGGRMPVDMSVRRSEYTARVGQDVRDIAALISLTRPPDIVVEDEIKWQTKALKVQGIAAVIVGVIQIQALTVSSSNERTNLNAATNAFFSIGVLLNVIGAFFALTSAYNLDANLFNVKSLVRGLDDKELDEITQLPLSSLAKKLARQSSMHPIQMRGAEDGGIMGDSLFRKTSLERYSRSIQENQSAGHLAGLTVSLGFVTCPIGILCLLQDTQPLAVRITAYTVVGILVCLRFLLIPMQDRLQRLMGRKII